VLRAFECAQNALYTAPTDLEAAEARLLLYQQALLIDGSLGEAQP